MSEQKNTKQDEQKSAYSRIESPEVRKKHLKQSPAYQKLVTLILERHDHKISEREAHRLARNLMGYCEFMIRLHDEQRSGGKS